MKRFLAALAVLMVALAAIASPAMADPATGDTSSGQRDASGSLTWIEDAPEYPVEPGEPADSLTAEEESALVEFEKQFPWKEAFASFGCEASSIDINDEGGKSMLLNCDDASVPLDQVSQIPTTAIAAAEGYPSAVDALQGGVVVSAEALTAETLGDEPPVETLDTSCSNEANQRHCINNSAVFPWVSSTIRTLSGTSAGVNRLGQVGFGNPCANGTYLNQSVRMTISPNDISLVEARSIVNSQWSSRWTISPFSYTRYCATL